LFGLGGSLVLGFLDLQAGHAQNRFFNGLEEWLTGVTQLVDDLGAPALAEATVEVSGEDAAPTLHLLLEAIRSERRLLEEFLTRQTGSPAGQADAPVAKVQEI